MADEMVLSVQKWLNTTYSGKAGFETAPENGQTGWPTIYSLREALQIETGAAGVGQGFGDATRAALKDVVGLLVPGYTKNKNITKLIKGAFWCKGISPSDFSDVFTESTASAIKELQSDAGLTADGKVTVNLMAALFDMSAFTLVASGKTKVREMQQYLNGKFSDGLGQIMPADGVYQRDTNTALIYALQRAEGLGTSSNGVYGNATIENCPVLAENSTNTDAVRVLQFGLIVNGFDVPTDGVFSSTIGDAVAAFSTVMNLEPITGRIAGNRVIKGLLTSNGDTTRDSIACDTSKQLTANDASLLKKYGFSIVGRYLTGTVGVGDNERAKNLTANEISLITAAGLSIFPIYQDGGATSAYFNSDRGYADGLVALTTAKRLGFASGTTIYFACDVDLQEGEIDATIVNHMKGVNQAFAANNTNDYHVGIYGTRNVCQHIIDNGLAVHCFVSDMSTGYSGNLGFPMADKWSFDQFIEYSIGSDLPIDQVAANATISDSGCNKFTPGAITDADKIAVVNDLLNGIIDDAATISFGKEVQVPTAIPGLFISWSATASAGNGPISISNGQISKTTFMQTMQDQLGGIADQAGYESKLNSKGIFEIGSKISEGSMNFTVATNSSGDLIVTTTVNVLKTKKFSDIDINVSIALKLTFKSNYWDDHGTLSTVTPSQQPAYVATYSLATVSEILAGTLLSLALTGLVVFVIEALSFIVTA